jgi:hypothetical protein
LTRPEFARALQLRAHEQRGAVHGLIVIPGVRISNGAVVGSNTVVTKAKRIANFRDLRTFWARYAP